MTVALSELIHPTAVIDPEATWRPTFRSGPMRSSRDRSKSDRSASSRAMPA